MPKEVQDAVIAIYVHMAAAFSQGPKAAELTQETVSPQGEALALNEAQQFGSFRGESQLLGKHVLSRDALLLCYWTDGVADL